MSTLRPVVLVCDRPSTARGVCGRKFVSGETDVSLARSEAEVEGWTYDPGEDEDACPVCNAPERAWRH